MVLQAYLDGSNTAGTSAIADGGVLGTSLK